MRAHARRLLPGAAVCLLALAVYANSFPGAFILDDVLIVRDNPFVSEPDLRTIIGTDYWGTRASSGMYRPLTILTYAANRALFGAGPFSFHLVNVLLNAAASLLLYLLLARLPLGPGVAWLAAALFAVHPIHGETVNTVVGRAEILAAAFTFLGLLAAYGRGRWHRPGTALCYALALFSKESAPAFIPLLLSLDAFTALDPRQTLRERRRLYLLLLAVTGAWLALRTWALAQSPMPPGVVYPTDNPLAGLPLLPRLLSALHVQMLYLRNLLFPYPLLGVYTANFIGRLDNALSLHAGGVVAAAGLLGLLAARGWRRRHGYALGIALYLAAFLVNANVFFLTFVAVADRLAYLPSAGFCLAASSLLLLPGGPGAPRARRIGARAAAIAYLALFAGLTLAWNPAFSSALRLWQHTVRADPGSGRAWLYLGDSLEQAGRRAEAEAAYRTSVTVEPAFPDSHLRYSRFLLDAGRPGEALRQAEEAIRLVPGSVSPAQIRAAAALLMLGRPRESLQRLDDVEAVYGGAIDFLEVRGKALDALGDADGAIEMFRRIAPERAIDRAVPRRLAELLLARGEASTAEKLIHELDGGNPDPDLSNLLGVALAAQGRPAEAAAAFEEAVRLEPGTPLFRENLAKAREDAARSASPGGPHAQPPPGPRRQRP